MYEYHICAYQYVIYIYVHVCKCMLWYGMLCNVMYFMLRMYMIYIYTTWISKQKYIQAHPGPLSQGPEGGPPESSILAKFWRPGHSKVPFFRYLYDPNVPQLGQWMDNFYGQLMDISKKTWINNVEIMRKYGESWIFLYISMDMMWKLFLKIWTYPWIFRYISMNRI